MRATPVFGVVKDVRDKLYRNARGGPNRSVPLASKRGLIVHWNGPTVHDDDMQALVNDSQYHAFIKNWGTANQVLRGDGLMYHLAIGQDGLIYLCRELGAVLWHCGAWPENEIAFSVLVLCAANRGPTSAQLTSLRAVCDRVRVAGYSDLAHIKGHQEVSPTDCPGPVVMPWVRTYRKAGAEPMPDDPYAAAKARLEALWQANQDDLGAQVKFELITRPWGDEMDEAKPALWCRRGLLMDTGDEAIDVTERMAEDARSYMVADGSVTPVG